MIVREVPDEKLLELALVENIQRQELNPVEEARAYRKLIDIIGLTQEMVAERVGRERSLVATTLRLLKLPNDILEMIEEGTLTAGHGRALLLTDDQAIQRFAAKAAVATSLSVRETERLIKNPRSDKSKTIGKKGLRPARDANIISAETKLRRKLGTGIHILPSRDGSGGKVEIEYYSSEDLDRIYQLLIRGEN